MPATVTIKPPSDYLLSRDVCSYGYFLLAPNKWDVKRRVFARVLSLRRGPVRVEVSQAKGAGGRLRVAMSRTLTGTERAELEKQLTRMLRLDVPASELDDFHRVDPRWKASGRGRLFRSPSMFEDVIKTVTSCNVTWPSTVQMNARLCEVLGRVERVSGIAEFPSHGRLAVQRPEKLRARCRVGYRDRRIVELARLFKTSARHGGIDPAWFEDPATPDESIRQRLLELPGIGPYAAANILQLLGRYGHLPLDTESVRHGKMVLGFKGASTQVMKRVRAHFDPFGRHAFRSYWFEVWAFYEKKNGPSDQWERDGSGQLFTSAHLSKD